jgi:hypothetical protein
MRSPLSVAAILVALALGGCSDASGTWLTITNATTTAPVDRLEVVLASPGGLVTVPARPGLSNVGAAGVPAQRVVYYPQAVPALAPMTGLAAGWTSYQVELSPTNGTAGTSYIPVVLGYHGDQLVAIGVYRPSGGAPETIKLFGGSVATYALTLEGVETSSFIADGDAPLVAGSATVVSCPGPAGAAAWRSGVAWQPVARDQLRLILAAPDGTLTRGDNLDCDPGTADDAAKPDCDDLRADVYAGADEACDGRDTDCDGAYNGNGKPMLKADCPQVDGCTVYAACVDKVGMAACSSVPDPACACGGSGTSCMTCTVPAASPVASQRVPCNPSEGTINTNICNGGTPCRVQVVAHDPTLQVKVQQNTGVFGDSANGVHTVIAQVTSPLTVLGPMDGWFALQLDYRGPNNVPMTKVLEFRVVLDPGDTTSCLNVGEVGQLNCGN